MRLSRHLSSLPLHHLFNSFLFLHTHTLTPSASHAFYEPCRSLVSLLSLLPLPYLSILTWYSYFPWNATYTIPALLIRRSTSHLIIAVPHNHSLLGRLPLYPQHLFFFLAPGSWAIRSLRPSASRLRSFLEATLSRARISTASQFAFVAKLPLRLLNPLWTDRPNPLLPSHPSAQEQFGIRHRASTSSVPFHPPSSPPHFWPPPPDLRLRAPSNAYPRRRFPRMTP